MSDDTFGDAVYEAWRRGRNPDLVDRDRLWYDEAQGYEPEACIEREIRRITPQPKEQFTDEQEQAFHRLLQDEGEAYEGPDSTTDIKVQP